MIGIKALLAQDFLIPLSLETPAYTGLCFRRNRSFLLEKKCGQDLKWSLTESLNWRTHREYRGKCRQDSLE